MCVCPFHDDKNPSMKVDRRFHCFGCQADGDVIDFVSRLEAVSPKEAALMLAQEFSIPYEDKEPSSHRKPPQESPEQQFRVWSVTASGCCAIIATCCAAGNGTMPPRHRRKNFTRCFVEALQKQAHVEYLLDVLLFSDMEERAALIASYGKEVSNLERRMADLAAGDTAGRRTDHARSTATPER